MFQAIKAFMLAGSPPHYATALGVLAYAALEYFLGRTKLVQANSSLELLANMAKKALLDRVPLLGRLVKAMATPAAMIVAMSLAVNGCALSTTPAGATTAQKLQSDMAAIGQVELDVKAQCGPQFAPLASTAGAIVSIAAAAGYTVAGNYAGAVAAAVAAWPAVYADAKAVACIVEVLKADYQKFKPSTTAWLMRAYPTLEPAVARRQLEALIALPPICSSVDDQVVCRQIQIDDEAPTDIERSPARLSRR